jgi:hypothetical protein
LYQSGSLADISSSNEGPVVVQGRGSRGRDLAAMQKMRRLDSSQRRHVCRNENHLRLAHSIRKSRHVAVGCAIANHFEDVRRLSHVLKKLIREIRPDQAAAIRTVTLRALRPKQLAWSMRHASTGLNAA